MYRYIVYVCILSVLCARLRLPLCVHLAIWMNYMYVRLSGELENIAWPAESCFWSWTIQLKCWLNWMIRSECRLPQLELSWSTSGDIKFLPEIWWSSQRQVWHCLEALVFTSSLCATNPATSSHIRRNNMDLLRHHHSCRVSGSAARW